MSPTGGKKRANLSAHKGEIRRWVDEGHSDEEIATALSTTASSVQSFRSRHGIHRGARSWPGRRQTPTFEGVLEHPPPTRRSKRRPKGIWFDSAIADTDTWASVWGSVREVRVRIGPSSIIIEAQEKGEYS